MSDAPAWLPPLVLFSNYGGNWNAYLDAIYEWFKQDFIDNKPVFQGRRLGLKRHPMTHGRNFMTNTRLRERFGIEQKNAVRQPPNRKRSLSATLPELSRKHWRPICTATLGGCPRIAIVAK